MSIFIYTLIAIIIIIAVGMWCLKLSEDNYSTMSTLVGIVGFITVICGLLAAILYFMNVWGWVASKHKAQIINREYNTNYTAEEVFFADDVIETIQQIKRKRVEVNGDLLRDEPKE